MTRLIIALIMSIGLSTQAWAQSQGHARQGRISHRCDFGRDPAGKRRGPRSATGIDVQADDAVHGLRCFGSRADLDGGQVPDIEARLVHGRV